MSGIDLDFGAISIDNATLKGEGYRFDEGLLVQMRQFKASPVKVVQVDVVHNEAVRHIGQEVTRTRGLVNQAIRSASKQLKITSDVIGKARSLLSIDGSESEIAEARLERFYKIIGAEKIDSSTYVDLSKLMEMYFSTKNPFEAGKDKKNEFPDAIALLALEGWADKSDINIIAVSQDKGWKKYSESSDRITVVPSLAKALEKFQPHNLVVSIVSKIREDSLLDSNNHVLQEIERAIISSIDGYDVYIEAESPVYFDWEDTSVSYVSHELDVNLEGLIGVRVVSVNNKEIVLKVGATVEVEVEASFNFSVRDSIDKNYVSLGGSVCTTTESYHTDVLLTLSGDWSQDFDNISVVDVEVLETIEYANFGMVEPDWRNEYEDEDRR